MMANPCRCTRRTQPDNAPAISPPTESAAYSRPTACGACKVTAKNGNSAVGIAVIIAIVSIRYVPSRSLRPAA